MADLRVELSGMHTASIASKGIKIERKRGSVIGALARHLLKELPSLEDHDLLIYRNGTLCFNPMSAKKWASLTVREVDEPNANGESIFFAPYRPPQKEREGA